MATILGWIATILFTICYIPQIVKTLRTKTTAGLSLWLLIISLIANIVALVYAILIHQPPLITKYILGIVFVSLCLGVYWRVSSNENLSEENNIIPTHLLVNKEDTQVLDHLT